MRLIKDINEMKDFSRVSMKAGKSIAFLPTMGCLHEGHMSLLRKGRVLGDILVLSIFVNPAQFGKGEDFDSYHRDLARDLAIANANDVDCVFNPSAEEMYPKGFQTSIDIRKLAGRLCGSSRPGHFSGVATVVVKLFNIVKPDIAIFGEKDFQQVAVIKRMIWDLNIDIDIVSMPIIREADGLAMSSRNNYLNKEERLAARCLYSSINRGIDMVSKGVKDAAIIIKEAKYVIEAESLSVIDYIKICDTDTLEDLDIVENKAVFALAVRIGKTRLIDNCILHTATKSAEDKKREVTRDAENYV